MPKSILITQCMQNDFVKPIGRFDPLPNLLHVGYAEAKRLLGENPKEGPVARIMSWAYKQPFENLSIIHIRDWHDSKSPQQTEHLQRFGSHCLADSEGAQFVFDSTFQNEEQHPFVVDSLGLNDFHKTSLKQHLAQFENLDLRVGLLGVWTEAKISFLAYELRTRYPSFELATCSALTASSSRSNHFLALDQMQKLLGVEVFPTVGQFMEFFGGNREEIPLIGYKTTHPEIVQEEGPKLTELDTKLLRYVFRECKNIKIRVFTGTSYAECVQCLFGSGVLQ